MEKKKVILNEIVNNLKTNYIDLYQLHNIQMKDNIDGALLALEEAKKENKIGHIGVTTHSLEVLEREVELNRFETIQFPYNIVENQGEELFKKAYEKALLVKDAVTENRVFIKTFGYFDVFVDGKKIPIAELMSCSEKNNCPYNVNGKCWNSTYSHDCKHRPKKEEE